MNIEFAGLSINMLDFFETTIPAIIIFIVGALVIAAMLYYHLKHRRVKSATIKYSDIRIVKRAARTNRQKLRFILLFFRFMAIALFIVAFARPRSGTEYQEVKSEGIDIMLALDVSSSMQAEDFKPYNRLYVAKEEIKKFIGKRINDRIGLVVFARYSFTQCPLTTDYGVLLNFIDQVDFGLVDDGTAIGMALANSVNRLRESESKSKIIVLLTDGDNNAGEIDPITAANIAQTFGIRIYTVGVGTRGNAPYPFQTPFGVQYQMIPVEIDEAILQQVADITDGHYFRATDNKKLEEIYKEIDKMEKTRVEITSYRNAKELFYNWALAGLLLLFTEIVLSRTYLRRLP